VRFDVVLWNSVAAGVHPSQTVRGLHHAVCGSLAIPPGRLLKILLDIETLLIEGGDVELGKDVPSFSKSTK
jgi:hypothetical protein